MWGLAEGIDTLIKNMQRALIAAIVMVPLAIWKLIDIATWLYHHVHITF